METISNFETIRDKAQKISALEACVQHVNLLESIIYSGIMQITYRVSDWYDCDSTELSYENGELL